MRRQLVAAEPQQLLVSGLSVHSGRRRSTQKEPEQPPAGAPSHACLLGEDACRRAGWVHGIVRQG